MGNGSIITIDSIEKSFGGVRALGGVSFDIKQGEILGLLGANGAGKSTLLKIIGGVQKSDNGQVVFEGNALKAETPHDAQKLGLISVYQELNVFLHMTVAENLFLGYEPKNKLGLVDRRRMAQDAKAVLSEFGLDISPNTLLQNLSVAKRHLIEIVRAMNENPKVLMLDEPTAALSDNQIQWLFQKVRELVAGGTTVIYVSHRLDEIVELCNRCVVLKDGKVSAVLDDNFDKKLIIQSMIGRNVELEKKTDIALRSEPVFVCKNLSAKGRLHDISFSIGKGEILGIGGLVGAGRSELLRALFGIDPIDSGSISIHGKNIKNKHPDDAIRNKIVLISEDRKLEGLFLAQPVVNNISADTISRWSRFGFIKRKQEVEIAKKTSEETSLDSSRVLEPVNTLSGGNQQKVVLGKALLTGAEVLLLDEPTRGVDVGAREDIYGVIKALAAEGKSILIVSSDWEELLHLSDRVITISEGKVTAELENEQITEENIMHYSTIANVDNTAAAAKGSGVFSKLSNIYLRSGSNTPIFGAFLLALMIVGALVFPGFLTFVNLRNILNQSFLYILLTLGQIFVIIHGYADLSMSGTLTVAGLVGLTIMKSGEGMVVPGILVMLAVGVAVGTIVSMIVVIGKMNAMIATFGINIILQGLALIITPRPISPSPDIFKALVKATFLGLPLILYIAAFFIVLIIVILNYTSLGRRIYAVGENPTAALWSGLSVKPAKFFSFIACSVMAVMGSLYLLGRSGAAEATVAIQPNLDAIAFALIGGGSFAGGKGSVGGSVLAVLSVMVLMNILSAMGVGTYTKDVTKGVLLVSIIVLNEYRASKAENAVGR